MKAMAMQRNHAMNRREFLQAAAAIAAGAPVFAQLPSKQEAPRPVR
ncbi:MAG: twin-arginine translocation signal domain-containing protein [Verrucomicrobia bacterium]|nr:twin-arginine translocation signal domain-containing protein [Verrucomicrobiota bacterium]